MNKNYTVVDQWPYWECMGFAVLWALKIMNPSIDHEKIARELNEDPSGLLSAPRAAKWFKERWYIKGIRYVRVVPWLVNKWIPIVVSMSNIDWVKAWTPPFFAGSWEKNNSHWTTVVAVNWSIRTHLNSWGISWWDKGLFYTDKNVILDSRLNRPFILIL